MDNHVFIINGLVYDLDSTDEWFMSPKMSYNSDVYPVLLFTINHINDLIALRNIIHLEAKDKPDLIFQLKQTYPNIQFVKKTKLVKLIYNIP